MTQVFFYHNAADRITASASLIGRAFLQRKALLVYAPDAEIAAALDRQLWMHPPTGFIPHVDIDSPLAGETLVLIASRLDSLPHDERLVNLSSEVPPGFARFTSLIEVVGQQGEERAAGRLRARFYKNRGYDIRYVDLDRKELMADDMDLLSRADSLIKPETAASSGDRRDSSRRIPRRRSFVASATGTPDTLARRSASDDDDVPLLTEVVLPAPAEPVETIDRIATKLRSTLADDLADRLDRQLARELPALLEATLVNAAELLQQSLETTIERVLSDFVAQRGQLRLALTEHAADKAASADQDQASGPGPQRDPV